jgi:hypothetical protein
MFLLTTRQAASSWGFSRQPAFIRPYPTCSHPSNSLCAGTNPGKAELINDGTPFKFYLTDDSELIETFPPPPCSLCAATSPGKAELIMLAHL